MQVLKNNEVKTIAELSEAFSTIPNQETKRFVIKIPKIEDEY